MKKLVLTMSTGHRPHAEHTLYTIKRYAEKINADFLCVKDPNYAIDPRLLDKAIMGQGSPGRPTKPFVQKFTLICDQLEHYDRIIWLDDSCIVNSDCPDLFAIVPENFFAYHNEGSCNLSTWGDITLAYVKSLGFFHSRNGFGNVGVMVISKCHRSLFNREVLFFGACLGLLPNDVPENTLIPCMLPVLGIPVFYLPELFNKMWLFPYYVDYTDAEPHDPAFSPHNQANTISALSAKDVRPGHHNHAFVYHIVSGWEWGSNRCNLAEKLKNLIYQEVDKV